MRSSRGPVCTCGYKASNLLAFHCPLLDDYLLDVSTFWYMNDRCNIFLSLHKATLRAAVLLFPKLRIM